MGWWLADLGIKELATKVQKRVLPNARHLFRTKARRCRACMKPTLMVAIGEGDEFKVCIRCRANLRFELLAEHIRERHSPLELLDILELDFRSPIRPLLEGSRSYTPSYFRSGIPSGSIREDGIVCQDITNLSFPDESLDLIVSSDVLEHVPDLESAFKESVRVLRPGGCHLFTVPPRPQTRQRARLCNGSIEHLLDPEYHLDPLSREGILAFWDIGPDLPQFFGINNLALSQVRGPEGSDRRTVWEARRTEADHRLPTMVT